MNKEYGSFLPLDLRKGKEFYSGNNVIRLNKARSGIYYVLKLLGLKKILMPQYQCETVRDFLLKRGIEITCYKIGRDFLPEHLERFRLQGKETALLLVNYFGILSGEKLARFADGFPYVILDNSQAFYKRPLENAYSVYSPRKFFGVPDGCYVVGDRVNQQKFEWKRDVSYPTSKFLLKRLETSCDSAYPDRMENERRIDESEALGMSVLTQQLLQNIDYKGIRNKRKDNFRIAYALFQKWNQLPIRDIVASDEDAAPMAYPLVVEDEGLGSYLIRNRVYAGKLWKYLIAEAEPDSTEVWLSRYLVPLPLDQRMDFDDLEWIAALIDSYLKNSKSSGLYT